MYYPNNMYYCKIQERTNHKLIKKKPTQKKKKSTHWEHKSTRTFLFAKSTKLKPTESDSNSLANAESSQLRFPAPHSISNNTIIVNSLQILCTHYLELCTM